MNQNVHRRSLRRWSSFTWMKGLLLVILLQLLGASPAWADITNPQDFFKITHPMTIDEPYLEWEYIDYNEKGYDDVMTMTRFFLGWDGVDKVCIADFGKRQANPQWNEYYGRVWRVGYAKRSDNNYYLTMRYYPNANTGTGLQSIFRDERKPYLKMAFWWDIDDNGSNDVKGEPTRSITTKYADIIPTPEVSFERESRTVLRAKTAENALTNYTGWVGGLCFTASSAEKFPDIWHKNELGNASNGSDGKVNKEITLWQDDERKPVTIYYHRYQQRISDHDGRQLLDGALRSYTHPGFQDPTSMTIKADKYAQTVSMTWKNNTAGRDSIGHNAVFRETDGDKNWVKIATLEYNATSYVDNTAYQGHKYDYKVMFIPTAYGTVNNIDLTSQLITPLSGNRIADFTTGFDITLDAKFNVNENGSNGILLSWKPETTKDKDGKALKFNVYRYDDLKGSWETLGETTMTSYTDPGSNLKAYKTYNYKVIANYWDREWSSEATVTYTAITNVTEVSASRGSYSGMVKLSWKAKQEGTSETRFVVSRKSLNDPTDDYVDIYEVSGTSTSYHYDDVSAQPGMYYYYRVTPYAPIPAEKKAEMGEWATGTAVEGDGFSLAKGIIAGRVTYGTGTAVEGVKVSLQKVTDKDAGNDDREQFYSLGTTDEQGAMVWTPAKKVVNNYLNNKPFTVQFWAKANANEASSTGNKAILGIPGKLSLYLVADAQDTENYKVAVSLPNADGTQTLTTTSLSVPANEFSNISLSSNGSSVYSICVADENGVDSVAVEATALTWSDESSIVIGGNNTAADKFIGFIDDVRVWSRALSKKEIQSNYQRILAGTESGLLCYWPLDEGIKNLPYAYDYSKKSGVPNGNHAVMVSSAAPETDIPDSDQLSLYALSTNEGAYEVRGVPFSGDGTSYIVRPTMGIHEFSPQYETRFVSSNSLTHNGVDFEDVSSFPVSGVVCYENTTIPVSGAYLYVDGTIASRDGEPLQTNDEGEFKIDVPIGDHYVSIQSNGHTFVDGGRYPADPNGVGVRHTFDREITGLTFYDNTLVTIAGRVAGGKLEEAKPLGVGVGTANIGQATIRLKHTGLGLINAKLVTNELSSSYVANESVRTFESATDKINSTAVVGLGEDNKSVNYITITTDPKTGEWSAKVPPLRYEAESITINSQNEIDFTSKLFSLDATNAMVVNSDTLDLENIFDYCAAAKVIYRSACHLDVQQKGNPEGVFGISKCQAKDILGNSTTLDLYTIQEDEDGNMTGFTYNYNYPVYKQLDKVAFNLSAYEEYVNKDGETPEYTVVPLPDMIISIQNEFASTTSVEENGTIHEMEGNTLQLDSLGHAQYIFSVGLPNIQDEHTRCLSIGYSIDGNYSTWKWNGNNSLSAIILGGMPKGNNFITEGPKVVAMVLRDPPGTSSSATWTKGTSFSTTSTISNTTANGTDDTVIIHLGAEIETSGGTPVFMVTNKIEDKANIETNVSASWEHVNDTTTVTTMTLTRDISTSDSPDFVGANGDIFFGYSTNVILGACTNVDFKQSQLNGAYELTCEDAISMGEQLSTTFAYTQNYIEKVLIPQLKDTKNNMLTYIEGLDITTVERDPKSAKFYSKIPKSDPRFGSSNSSSAVWGNQARYSWTWEEKAKGYIEGPSYYIVLPYEEYIDSIKSYNTSIENWEKILGQNEKAKIDCIKGAYDTNKTKKINYSFDAGTIITESADTTYSKTTATTDVSSYDLHVGATSGILINNLGFTGTLSYERHREFTDVTEQVNDTTEVFTYTLKEDGDDDYLSVDVFSPAPDGFGPIFYTRAGATCAPWENEVTAKYAKGYEGFILQQKTLQIEKPELRILDTEVTGVPSGKSAKFRIELCNNSETGEDCYYGLWVNPESNSDGLQIFMDGKNIATGIDILVPAGEPIIKTMEARQTDTDILDYKNISLCMYSTSQPDDTGTFLGIYSNGSVNFHFQPSVTDIDLAASTSLVNIDNADDVTFSMSGYDYTQESFKEIRLQYKGENDANFKTLKTFTKDAENDEDKIVALSGTAKLTYVVDLSGSDFNNQTYVFRALAVGYRGSDEVTTPSDEIRIVRDMARPQLITMPTPTSGILLANDVITLTFNEDIRDNVLAKADNFSVTGKMNESEVAHDVALSLSGEASAAKTESTIDLNQKPFSINLWMKYTQDGRILQHGTLGQQFTAAVVDGKLALTVAGQTVTSELQLPKDKWLYLAISYDNSGETPVVTAGYGLDAGTVTLFKNQTVGEYEGNGPIALGGDNLNATVQELSIWNSARTLDEALADMSLTKNQYTTGLLGYWQMNEGYGLQAEDRSRSRNMTLAAENAWFLNSGTNYELTLDGTKNVVANAGLVTLDSESYLIETWFKADENANTNSSILGMKNRFDIRLNAQGALEMGIGNDYTVAYATKNLYDGQWHHLALNVLKNTNGSAILYLDGKATRQYAASVMPQLAGSLYLGTRCAEDETYSQQLKGALDEVRVWKGNRTADLIKASMHTHVRNDEQGLVAYYPMEKRGLNQFLQVETTATLDNMQSVGAAISAVGAEIAPAASQLALANAPALENVQFHYVASERQISISLDEQPYKIENCNIYLTAHDVLDKNGNAAQPISWTVYVQQNQLKWEETEVEAEAVSGEGLTFTAELTNRSATTDVWSISNMPSWLSANVETGALSPVSTQKIKFTVDPSVAVGNYEVTVYAIGAQNIQTPLTIKLKVIGQVPDWNPVPGAETMAVVGLLKMDGVISSDPDDMIAAFRGQECVGMAHPAYSSRYGSYMITMNIYGSGDSAEEGARLNYKVYDASTGTIYPSVAASNENAYIYTSSKLVGSFANPVEFAPENKIEQDLSLDRSGWKWFSMNVTPEVNNVADIFKDANGKVNYIKGTEGYAEYEGNGWDGPMSLDPAKMYKLRATEAFAETSIGTPVTTANTTITLNHGWNWIGYPAQASNSLANAFADANPQEGDILMSQSLFAIYSEGEWVGSLKGVTPGEGYKYSSNASSQKTFKFQTPSTNGRSAAPAKAQHVLQLNFEDNMAMIAQIVKDGQVVENAQVSVYAGDELCGYSAASDDMDRHFITIGGSDKQRLTFVIRMDDQEYAIEDVMSFEGSKIYGSLNAPYVIDMDQTTALKNMMASKAIRKIDLYDANGALVRTISRPASLLNAASMGNVPAGTYLQHIIYEDGKKAVVKLLK